MAEAANRQPGEHINWAQREAELSVCTEAVPIAERWLTEVDHLNQHRLPDGTIPQWAKDEVSTNLYSAIQEAAMPFAITRTQYAYEADGTDEVGREHRVFKWLGKTAVENAMSGYRIYTHPEALKRVAVEVDEAHYAEKHLKPGLTKLFVSPRMTPEEVMEAGDEVDQLVRDGMIDEVDHLTHEDALRGSQVSVDKEGGLETAELQSLLFKNIPLSAWVSWGNDENNIFGKSLGIKNDGRALSVMQAHNEMVVETSKLTDGLLTILAEVIPHIEDSATRQAAQRDLQRFHEVSQADIDAKTKSIEKRWLAFEIEVADSLRAERATPEINRFINSMQSLWNEENLEVILEHQLPNAQYKMTRKLAAVVERAKQNTLWTRAAVITGNDEVLKQLDVDSAQAIYRDEMFIQTVTDSNPTVDLRALEAQLDQRIAGQNIKVGGGCPGINEGEFDGDPFSQKDGAFTPNIFDKADNPLVATAKKKERKTGKIKKGVCIIMSCPSRPGETKVGACSICVKYCQPKFENGEDPTKDYVPNVLKSNSTKGNSSYSTTWESFNKSYQSSAASVGAKAVQSSSTRREATKQPVAA